MITLFLWVTLANSSAATHSDWIYSGQYPSPAACHATAKTLNKHAHDTGGILSALVRKQYRCIDSTTGREV